MSDESGPNLGQRVDAVIGEKLIDRGYGVVAIDFDATIAHYDGWKGPGIFGDPIDGAKEALDRLYLKGYTIIIFTTRGTDAEQVKDYLRHHHLVYHHFNENKPGSPGNVSTRKVLADVYIDDRAMLFDGRWEGMVEKVEDFIPWNRRENRRPSLNLMIAGYHVDQVSLYVPSVDRAVEEYCTIGHDKWVVDIVDAKVVELSQEAGKYAHCGDEFRVTLAFNYTIYPCEFELIALTQGWTVQIPTVDAGPGLSHYGYHVNDLEEAIQAFERCDYPLMSHVRTLHHGGCPHHYEYAFMDTRQLGFISKLIWRIPENYSI